MVMLVCALEESIRPVVISCATARAWPLSQARLPWLQLADPGNSRGEHGHERAWLPEGHREAVHLPSPTGLPPSRGGGTTIGLIKKNVPLMSEATDLQAVRAWLGITQAELAM